MDTSIANEAIQILIGVLGVVLTTLTALYLPRLFRALERRFGADIPDAAEQEALRLADRAIHYAEEWGRRRGKELADKIPAGGEKLKVAAEYFRDRARPQVEAWLAGQVEDLIESRLGEHRALPRPDWAKDPE